MFRDFIGVHLPALPQPRDPESPRKNAACYLAPFPPKSIQKRSLANHRVRELDYGITKWGNTEHSHSTFLSPLRPERPFVIEADRMQQQFDNDFGEYVHYIETCPPATRLGGIRELNKNAVGTDAMNIVKSTTTLEAVISAAEQTPSTNGIEIVKTLHLGPKVDKTRSLVKCVGFAGVRAASTWVETSDLKDKWQSVNSHRTCDITNSSLKSAMAISEASADDRVLRTNFRCIGAAERSLQDRSARTNPDCTRPPLPMSTSPRLAESTQTNYSPRLIPPLPQICGGIGGKTILGGVLQNTSENKFLCIGAM